MTKAIYTPSAEVEALASQAVEKHCVAPTTIAIIKKVVMTAIDNALQNPDTRQDIILLETGFDAGMNILWDIGHSPREKEITSFVTQLTREYARHAVQNMTN